MKKLIFACLASTLTLAARADNPLYETGPAQDSSFVRFLNASEDKANVVNGAAKVALTAQGDGRISRFYPVKAGAKLAANVQVGNAKAAVEVVAKPGEFVTIAIVSNGTGIETVVVKDTPTDFNASKASVALLNLDKSCNAAALNVAEKNTAILEAVKPASLQRRLVNPIGLKTQAVCDAKDAGKVVDLGQLQPGERYSVVIMPGKKARQTFFVRDSTS
ncbi:alginate O-acetyltransferase AlgF [Undibacterium pigrum]|uniref:Alginate biosynthesis protein AlgF n=1 Tax=Undibacterium pigrum TaxID=401470 RepID=A0A318IUE2_9BURK|nr:alginate O-acetyltransferase AlgF [Undibacterium pigrum]PXX39786.1 alginate O-acetyltransferase AlgF [Undibacterium pigrum]